MRNEEQYVRALEKYDMSKEEIITILEHARDVVKNVPEPFKSCLLDWLDKQSRDDFMVHGGVWEELVSELFLLNQPTEDPDDPMGDWHSRNE